MNLPETTKGKVVAGGSVLGAIAAAALTWQQINTTFVLREPYAADQLLVQVQIIDVQIIQANSELNAILQREAIGKATPHDLAQKIILINRITELQKLRGEMLKKGSG